MNRIFQLSALAAAALLAACGPKDPSDIDAAEGVEQGILILGNGSEPEGLDVHLVTGVPENNILSSLVEGLISYHPTDDNEPFPGVAERWEPNDDFSTWTFHLREDARWSNGDPVTAGDFVYSLQRILEPEFAAPYAEMVYLFMENAEAFYKGELTDFTKVGCKALDDRTLEIKLVGPTPYFPNVLKHYTWFPVHPPTIEKFGGMKERLSKWTQEEFVCNGPFVLEEWTQNKIIRVKKSPTYWDAANVKLNGIHYLPIQEANTEERLFRSGAMHLGYTCPLDKIPYYKERFPELIHMDPMYASYFYRVNTTPPSEDMPPDQRAAREALAKREVRMALALAIDQQQIVEHLLRGGQIPASGITPRDQSYDTPRVISYQPDRARELLAEAGFPKGRGFPTGVDILINTSEAHKAVAEVVQEMWRKELNIEIAVRNEEWKVYLETQRELNFNISRAGWNADYHDPFTFLSMFVKDGGNNNTGWSSEEYEKLLADSTRTADPKERIAILQKAETVLLEDAPILPIYWYTRTYLLHPAVKGWHPKLLDNRPFKTISLDPNWRDSFSGTAPAGIGG